MGTLNLKKAFSDLMNRPKQAFPYQHSNTAKLQIQEDRDETFDVLKGIAIILMIVGHCGLSPFRSFIYSFHMPLFFFVAGYFLKKRPLRKEISLSTKRLIIPYIFAAFWLCIVTICIDPSRLQSITTACLLGFRAQYVPNWINAHVGLLWFILALFWARLITVTLIQRIKSDIWLGIVFFSLALIGMFLNNYVFVPFCIPQGMCAAGFLFAGHLINKYKVLERNILTQIFPILAIIWAYNWSKGGVDMFKCLFRSGYIFDLIGAMGAFTALYMIVKQCYNRNSFLWQGIHFWGRYSLVIYCVHSMEHSVSDWQMIACHLNIPLCYLTPFSISARMTIAFLFTLLLLKIQPIRELIFQIK